VTRRVGVVGLATLAALAGTAAMPARQTPASMSPAGQVASEADRPSPRTDQNSMTAHAQLLDKAAKGGIDVYFIGDSITRRWGATDYPELLANWTQNFFGWNAADFAWGADRIENILWRLDHGELDHVDPKVIVILAGTNNVGNRPGPSTKVAEITRGLAAVVYVCRQKAPGATIILTGIFPRNDNMSVIPEIVRLNENLAALADGRRVRYLDVNDKLADRNGRLFEGMMNERDQLHPTLKGYQVWADGLKPILTELIGPPASADHAPPPTGDPSASGRSVGRSWPGSADPLPLSGRGIPSRIVAPRSNTGQFSHSSRLARRAPRSGNRY
jgi:lysophospholipase L1-like esterase